MRHRLWLSCCLYGTVDKAQALVLGTALPPVSHVTLRIFSFLGPYHFRVYGGRGGRGRRKLKALSGSLSASKSWL